MSSGTGQTTKFASGWLTTSIAVVFAKPTSSTRRQPWMLPVLLGTLALGPAHAETGYDANAVFSSQKVLEGAVSDIGKMQDDELRSFTRYLAECDDEAAAVEIVHACQVAYTAYSIEFGRTAPGFKRPIDDLMLARSILSSDERMDTSRPDINQRTMDAISEKIAHRVLIVEAIKGAARSRFIEIRKQSHHG